MSEIQTPATATPTALSILNLQQQIKEQASHAAAASALLVHDEVLNALLEQIKPVDFRELAGLSDEEEKLKQSDYVICVVEEVLRLADVNRWGLAKNENSPFVYIYNGAYWKTISEKKLSAFLGMAAERMGVDKRKARFVGFKELLLKQFLDAAYLPAPQPSPDTVRINLSNGTFVISPKGNELRAPKAEDFLLYQLPFPYNPAAKAPKFQAFLDKVQPDADCQQLLAEYIGYVFVSNRRLKLERALLLYGGGANGKSVFYEVITALLGPENISHYSLESLTTPPAYSRANLANKLVNYVSEISGNLEANCFKQMTSGETIEARLPYGQPFELRDYARLIFNCNTLPGNAEQTEGYFRRFLIVPFNVTIPRAEQDTQLAAKIIATELSGVFNWVLAGLERLLQRQNFAEPAAVAAERDNYRKSSDSVRMFLDELQYVPDTDYKVSLKDMHREYQLFCKEDLYKPVGSPNFKKRLEAAGFLTTRAAGGNMVYARKKLAF
ncbi:DNA primase family protein [Solirubrum puertoriconensis]|uniref:DNA primase n=1 Tax=Solirubrum puertoriconensis TaxID=1751427 RepID=A0A9X0HNN8_SOLP1|nr:phage/plasmid primase, P4 family [Solirubrum puertoriconensis]KUG09390.1 DNA primase [Solirubrum puertoriconensis]